MKIYTRTGDRGETGLFGGGRVPKDHVRVEAYGAVDELNAVLGLAAAQADGQLQERIRQVQHRLFQLGADLATPGRARAAERVKRVAAEHVTLLEGWIDETQAELQPLQRFILPGGEELACRLHLARTVCRRAERRVVTLSAAEESNPEAVRFLNRLADLLFVWARLANRQAGVEDIPWQS